MKQETPQVKQANHNPDLETVLRAAAQWQPMNDMPPGIIGMALSNAARRRPGRKSWGAALAFTAVACMVVFAVVRRGTNSVVPNNPSVSTTTGIYSPAQSGNDSQRHPEAGTLDPQPSLNNILEPPKQQTALVTNALQSKIEKTIKKRRIRQGMKRRKPIWTHQTVAVQETGVMASGWTYSRTADGDIIGEPVLIEMPVAQGVSISPASYERSH